MYCQIIVLGKKIHSKGLGNETVTLGKLKEGKKTDKRNQQNNTTPQKKLAVTNCPKKIKTKKMWKKAEEKRSTIK